MKRHRAEAHGIHDSKDYLEKCGSCEFRAIDRNALADHRARFHGKVKFTCEQCDFTADNRLSVSNHAKVFHPPSPQKSQEFKKFKCYRCNLHILYKFCIIIY